MKTATTLSEGAAESQRRIRRLYVVTTAATLPFVAKGRHLSRTTAAFERPKAVVSRLQPGPLTFPDRRHRFQLRRPPLDLEVLARAVRPQQHENRVGVPQRAAAALATFPP